jgi:hypothetical protein
MDNRGEPSLKSASCAIKISISDAVGPWIRTAAAQRAFVLEIPFEVR